MNITKKEDLASKSKKVVANENIKEGITSYAGNQLSWIEKYQDIALVLAFILIFLYVAPVYMILIAAYKTDLFQETSLFLSWFNAFMKSSNATLSEFHKILFPIMSALSVIIFRRKPSKAMLSLGFFILFSFVITLVVGVIFDMNSTQIALSGLKDPINIDLARAFFTRVQETLMMYFMMLIGISVANSGERS